MGVAEGVLGLAIEVAKWRDGISLRSILRSTLAFECPKLRPSRLWYTWLTAETRWGGSYRLNGSQFTDNFVHIL
jgi:hypothetical protein